MCKNIFENTLKRLMYFFGTTIFPPLHIGTHQKSTQTHTHIHTHLRAFMPPLLYHEAPF